MSRKWFAFIIIGLLLILGATDFIWTRGMQSGDPTQARGAVPFASPVNSAGILEAKVTFRGEYPGAPLKSATLHIWNGYNEAKTFKLWVLPPSEYTVDTGWGKAPPEAESWFILSDPVLAAAPHAITEYHLSLNLPKEGTAVTMLEKRWQAQIAVFETSELSLTIQSGSAIKVYVYMRE